jgi:hypothetical protein
VRVPRQSLPAGPGLHLQELLLLLLVASLAMTEHWPAAACWALQQHWMPCRVLWGRCLLPSAGQAQHLEPLPLLRLLLLHCL